MRLTEKLLETKNRNIANIPNDIYAVMDKATQDLIDLKLPKSSPKKGDILPDFKLNNHKGTSIDLTSLLKKGTLVVSFYRGGWCPYCNLELKALNDALPQIKELGAQLIAITPETPDNSLTTLEKNELSFDVLSDLNNQYAKELGLVFKLPEELVKIYNTFGLDVEKHNGNKDFELPIPATYVIDKNGVIQYEYTPEDYTERLDPEVVLNILNTLKNL